MQGSLWVMERSIVDCADGCPTMKVLKGTDLYSLMGELCDG